MAARAKSFFRPHLEQLEARWNPAGNVRAVQIGSLLVLTGDLFDNGIQIDQPAANAYTITGVTQSGFATTINGGAAAPTFFGITNVQINTANGNDVVTFPGAALVAGNLTITGAAGNHTATLTDVTVLGTMTVNNGNGNNVLFADNLAVGQNLNVTNGNGNNLFQFTTGLTVVQNLNVTNGRGNSAVLDGDTALNGIATFTVGGGLKITNGDGNEFIQLTSAGPGAFSTVGRGGIVISNHTGADEVILANINSQGPVLVNNGNGDATGAFLTQTLFTNFTTETANNTANSSVTITNLSGPVDTEIVASDIAGLLTINSGTGTQSVTIDSGLASPVMRLASGLTITGGGAATINLGTGISGNGVIITGPVNIANSVAMTLTVNNLTLTGNLAITGGTGADSITINSSAVHGATTIRAGNGDNTVAFQTVAGTDQFFGGVQVTGGTGNDLLLIGVDTTGAPVAGALAQFFGTIVAQVGTGTDLAVFGTASGTAQFFSGSAFQGFEGLFPV